MLIGVPTSEHSTVDRIGDKGTWMTPPREGQAPAGASLRSAAAQVWAPLGTSDKAALSDVAEGHGPCRVRFGVAASFPTGIRRGQGPCPWAALAR